MWEIKLSIEEFCKLEERLMPFERFSRNGELNTLVLNPERSKEIVFIKSS